MIVAGVLSEHMHYSKQVSAYQKSLLDFKQNVQAPVLPKECELKFVLEIPGTPGELAAAISDEKLRPQWEQKLQEVARLNSRQLSLKFAGSNTSYTVSHDFEMLAASQGKKFKSFMVHELITVNGGTSEQRRIYLLEEIHNKPHRVRMTVTTTVKSEQAGKDLLKQLLSLRAMVRLSDREQGMAGCMADLQKKQNYYGVVTGLSEIESFDEQELEDTGKDIYNEIQVATNANDVTNASFALDETKDQI